MSDTQNTTTKEDREKEQAGFKATCNKYVEKGLKRDVTVQFLLERLTNLGCKPPEGFIKCVDCGDRMAGGGFGMVEEISIENGAVAEHEDAAAKRRRDATPQCQRSTKDLQDQLQAQKDGKAQLKLLPEIFLCQQHLRNETHANQSMVHELIHAVDMCRTKMDPLNNCVHMACTEIRAENLSGECDWTRELGSGRLKSFAKHGQTCVKRRAALSLKANPNCAEKADEYIDAAFERCYRDTFPFDRHPNLR
mmetsp:Transcript_26547/g.40705  ORF Transcript_26547/g.40705 Transcript_26547/m.40705 type:complete len:250 (-) Transcript_26547:49-798(-)|eukprot:CAMPEP_0195295268 /NCGR_PEP_ID=MMETSP0707-20130614/16981_1 /TAXON_ID=33640 /ORGANISM="Asterionellopsis glacialis, Strain CCMP134" /LENGTH=249 /DNA_ID=CAMNT_0040356453 /DNA_START=183 /DNA_END=932 /DNA_ORIENTATION=+